MTPRLLRLANKNNPLCSGSGILSGNGPDDRLASPDLGGSILITSAPKSPSSLPQKGADTDDPHSTTRMFSSAAGRGRLSLFIGFAT